VEGLLACPMVTQRMTTDVTIWNRNFFTDVRLEVLTLVRMM
jgi:hypothetical protein